MLILQTDIRNTRLCGYLRRFIPGCSKLTKELRECAKANPKKFNLSEAARKEVDTIKEIITADTCLAHPNENEQYFIHVDASKDGIGAILTQLDNNKKHRVIEYASRVLTPAQSRYSNTIREALGVIWSLDHFRHYIIDRNPIVFTDCDCLTHLAKDDATGIPKVAALRSWLARMLHYQPKLVHKPGKLMAIPDALSRHYVEYLIYDKDSERIEDSAEVLGSMIRTAWESRYIPNQGLRMQDDLLKKLPTTEVDEFKDTREIRVLVMSTHQQQAVNEFKKNLMWEDDDDEDDDHHQESDKEDEAEIILPSDVMIANEQRHDLQLAPLIEYLVDRTLPKSRSQRAHIKRIAHQYYLDGKGTLRKIVLRDKTEQNIGDPVVLPRQLWDQTISAYHDNPLGGGHRKRNKLIKSLRQNYTFEGMDFIISHLHTKSALLMKISCCPNIFLLLFGFSLRPTSPFGFSLRPTSQFGFSLRPTSQFGFSLRPTSPFGFSTSPHFFIWIFTSPHFSVWIFTSPHFSVWIFHFASLLHLDFHFAPLLSLDFPLCPTSLFGFSTSPHFSVWIFTSPHFSVWIFHFAPLLSLDFPLRPTSRRVGGELE